MVRQDLALKKCSNFILQEAVEADKTGNLYDDLITSNVYLLRGKKHQDYQALMNTFSFVCSTQFFRERMFVF